MGALHPIINPRESETKKKYSRPMGLLPSSPSQLPVPLCCCEWPGQDGGIGRPQQPCSTDGSSVHRGIDLRDAEMRCTAACCGRFCFWKEIATVASTTTGAATMDLQATGRCPCRPVGRPWETADGRACDVPPTLPHRQCWFHVGTGTGQDGRRWLAVMP